MTKSPLHLDNPGGYESVARVDSEKVPGVRFGIRRLSFGRRIDLMKRIREVGGKIEYLEAGDALKDKIDAAILGAEVERLYLEWGLAEVDGLMVDGEPATPALLIEKGPLELANEIVARVKRECGLLEEERKN